MTPLANIGIVMLAVVSFTAGWWIGHGTSSQISQEVRLARLELQLADARAARPAPAPAAARAQPAAAPAPDVIQTVEIAGAPLIGPESAPVTIVEFSDFECPFCSRVNPVLEQLRETYPEEVRVAFKHFPLAFHKQAMVAHKASVAAADQGKFWEMHDLIFGDRDKLDPASLRAHAESIGLDMAKYDASMESPDLEQRIQADMDQGQQLGVRGTPSFFINGRMLSGAKPYADFEQRVKEELEAKEG